MYVEYRSCFFRKLGIIAVYIYHIAENQSSTDLNAIDFLVLFYPKVRINFFFFKKRNSLF